VKGWKTAREKSNAITAGRGIDIEKREEREAKEIGRENCGFGGAFLSK